MRKNKIKAWTCTAVVEDLSATRKDGEAQDDQVKTELQMQQQSSTTLIEQATKQLNTREEWCIFDTSTQSLLILTVPLHLL